MTTKTTKPKYFWGEEPFVFDLNFAFMMLGCSIVSTLILYRPQDPPAIDTGCDIQSVRWTILASIVYFFVYYNLLGQQAVLKAILNSTNDTAHHTATRIAYNTLEQMGAFLVLTWLFTIYIDANLGGRFGLLYATMVFFYALGFAFYGHFTVLCEFSTQPRYTMILYMALSLLRSAFWPDSPSLRAILPSSWPLLTGVLFVAEFIFVMFGWLVLGFPLAKLNASNNPSKKID